MKVAKKRSGEGEKIISKQLPNPFAWSGALSVPSPPPRARPFHIEKGEGSRPSQLAPLLPPPLAGSFSDRAAAPAPRIPARARSRGPPRAPVLLRGVLRHFFPHELLLRLVQLVHLQVEVRVVAHGAELEAREAVES